MVCSEETYTRLLGEQNYMMVSVMLEKDVSEADVNRIRDPAGDYLSWIIGRKIEMSTAPTGCSVLQHTVFKRLFPLITVLNIMNSISIGVSARIKQYGCNARCWHGKPASNENDSCQKPLHTLPAVRLLEIVLGLLLHYLIYVKIIFKPFWRRMEIPVTPIAIIILLILFSCIAGSHQHKAYSEYGGYRHY